MRARTMRRARGQVLGTVLTFAVLAGVSPPARAQGHPAPRPGGGQDAPTGAGQGAPGPGGDEEMRAAIEQVMLVRLKRALALTPEQEPHVMPKVQGLLAARRDYAPKRRVAVAHLRAVMTDPAASDGEIQKALRNLRDMDEAFREQQQAMRRDVDRELSPRQQARLYFFEERFRRAMQQRMADAVQRGGRGRPQSPAPDPGTDDDAPDDSQ